MCISQPLDWKSFVKSKIFICCTIPFLILKVICIILFLDVIDESITFHGITLFLTIPYSFDFLKKTFELNAQFMLTLFCF